MVPVKLLTAIQGTALAVLLLAGCAHPAGTAVTPAATPGAAPSVPLADMSLSCAPVDDQAPSGAPTSDLYAVVTMDTSALVEATQVDVTVIGFSPAGVQLGTAVIAFNGPFAAGQTFQGQGGDMGNVASCEIATVAADSPVTYDNQSPAELPGAHR